MLENVTLNNGTEISTASITKDQISTNRPSFTNQLLTYSNYELAVNLGLYLFPIIIGLGTIGNVLSFLVMVRRTMRITPTCFYMAALAISDTVILYIDCLKRWSFIKYGGNTWITNSAGCRTVSFLTYSSFHYSVWIIVAMTTERCLAIRYPLKRLTCSTVGKTKAVCVIILACVLLLNCQLTWSVRLDKKGYCSPEDNYYEFHRDIMPWIDAVFYSFLPFAVLITFNVLIICSFSLAHEKQKHLNGRQQTYKLTNQRRSFINNRMTAMLLAVTFTFIFMTAPKVILFCIRYQVFNFLKYNTYDLEEISLYALLSRIADLCIYTNHAINFLLYCVSGQRFRKELKQMFSFITPHSRNVSVRSSKLSQAARYQTMNTVTSNLGLSDYDIGHENRVIRSFNENTV